MTTQRRCGLSQRAVKLCKWPNPEIIIFPIRTLFKNGLRIISNGIHMDSIPNVFNSLLSSGIQFGNNGAALIKWWDTYVTCVSTYSAGIGVWCVYKYRGECFCLTD